MTGNKSFGDHVWMLNEIPSSPSVTWDIIIGVSCSVTGLLGFTGNCLALRHFYQKTDLASLLYKHLCSIDIIMCLCQIPVIHAFLSSRNPGMFNDKLFCLIWTVVFDTTSKIYPMAVLLLSTSRTVAIVYPFYRIRKRIVIASLYVYLLYLGLHQGMNFIVGFTVLYGADSCYCFPYMTNMQSFFMTVEYVLLSIESGLPPVFTFISFIVSTIKLMSKSAISSTQTQQRRAALTIMIFTGVFLLCYLPIFCLCALYVSLSVIYKDEFSLDSGPFSNHFMLWYSFPLSRCFLSTLNATLDVVIYFTRMKDFRVWLAQMIRNRKEKIVNGSSEKRKMIGQLTIRTWLNFSMVRDIRSSET